MLFPDKLESGYLLRRYKRFLCDVQTKEGEQITIHCPNTGSMKNCCPEKARVWFSRSDNPKRKYAHTWEMVEDPSGKRIVINTHLANKLVVEALEQGKIETLAGYKDLRTEVPYGEEKSRIDILLESETGKLNYIEVKSVSLLEDDGWGYFPDAISVRAQKHLRELMSMVAQGHEATLFFCVQHEGISRMKAASHIDAKYADLLKQVQQSGVNVLAYACQLDTKGIFLSHKIPFIID